MWCKYIFFCYGSLFRPLDQNDKAEVLDNSAVPQSTEDEPHPFDADDVQSTNTYPVHSYLLLTREDSSMVCLNPCFLSPFVDNGV